jgi:hypothetical protein
MRPLRPGVRHLNMTIRDDLNIAIKEVGIKGFTFIRLTKYEAVLNRIAERFLAHGRLSLNYIWLWEHFQNPKVLSTEKQTTSFLKDCLLLKERYWFVASEEDGKYWVAESTGKAIIQVIEEMYPFEYYIAQHDFKWLLCENHHGVFIKTESA